MQTTITSGTPLLAARRLAASDYVDVLVALDGATAEVNHAVRGDGSYHTALRAMRNLAAAGMAGFKISVVITRLADSEADSLPRQSSVPAEQ